MISSSGAARVSTTNNLPKDAWLANSTRKVFNINFSPAISAKEIQLIGVPLLLTLTSRIN